MANTEYFWVLDELLWIRTNHSPVPLGKLETAKANQIGESPTPRMAYPPPVTTLPEGQSEKPWFVWPASMEKELDSTI